VQDERDELIRRICDTQRHLGHYLAEDRSSPLFSSSLTMRQLKVVILLAHAGSLAGQDLARSLGVGLGTVTGIIDRLIAQGLVARHEDPQDRRVRRAELTQAGRTLVQELNDAGLNHFRRLIECLDTETLHDLARVTGKILQAAEQLRPELSESIESSHA